MLYEYQIAAMIYMDRFDNQLATICDTTRHQTDLSFSFEIKLNKWSKYIEDTLQPIE